MIGQLLMQFAVTVQSVDYKTGLPETKANSSQIDTVMQIVIATLAAISVLMIVIAGFRMVVGQGNPQEIAKARSTIMYAIVGLILAFCAQAILMLALDRL